MQYGFHFNGKRCTGCKTCVAACRDYHDLTVDFAYRKVYEVSGGGWRQIRNGSWRTDAFVYHVSQNCAHCAEPACTAVCPTGAMSKDEETGLVSVDSSRCIGCGYCNMACPYGNPEVDREKGHSVKCDGCIDRVREGKLPVCAEACPLRAIDFGDIDDLRERFGIQDAVFPLPPAQYTHPSVVITEPPHAVAAGSAEAAIVNTKEVL